MWVVIDNSTAGQMRFFYTDNHREEWQEQVYPVKSGRSLAQYFDEFSRDIGLRPEHAVVLGVVAGKGSFTSTRVAVTFVNALSYARGWPVAAVGEDRAGWEKFLATAVPGRYISARYSAEANIGQAKPRY